MSQQKTPRTLVRKSKRFWESDSDDDISLESLVNGLGKENVTIYDTPGNIGPSGRVGRALAYLRSLIKK